MPGRKLCQRGACSRLPLDDVSEPRTVGLARTGDGAGLAARAAASLSFSPASAFAATSSAGQPPASPADRRSTSRAATADIAVDRAQASNSADFGRFMVASRSVGIGGGSRTERKASAHYIPDARAALAVACCGAPVPSMPDNRAMHERGLLEQLEEGPVSGDALARRAGVTRAAIWKRFAKR